MTIGALAKAAGVAVDTLRYYERRGLLPEPGRTAAGHRIYTPADGDRVRFVRRAQALGFTLAETQLLLGLRGDDDARAGDVLALTRRKIEEQQAKLAELKRIEAALRQLAEACPVDAPAADCPILTHLAAAGDASFNGKGVEP